jgi:hypothetical protein
VRGHRDRDRFGLLLAHLRPELPDPAPRTPPPAEDANARPGVLWQPNRSPAPALLERRPDGRPPRGEADMADENLIVCVASYDDAAPRATVAPHRCGCLLCCSGVRTVDPEGGSSHG